MRFLSWLRDLTPGLADARGGRTLRSPTRRQPVALRLHLEHLEGRWCPASYSINNLGTLGGAGSGASAINNAGQVQATGGSSTPDSGGYGHAFLWTQGGTNGVSTNPQMRDLGVPTGFHASYGAALNNAGQVAGDLFPDTSPYDEDGFFWDGTTMQDVGTLGGAYTLANGINNAVTDVHPVQVVGESRLTTGESHAFLWQNGAMTDLNTLLPAGSGWVLGSATGINDNQQIVGSGLHNGLTRGFLFSGGTVTDLGALPGATTSFATVVNSTGQVAGGSGSPFHAFLWTNGAMTALPVLRGTSSGYYKPFGLNNGSQIQVVGQVVDIGANDEIRALLWQGSNVIELTRQISPSAGWSILKNATGVNDAGLIVGSGTLTSGVGRAFLMTPTHGGKQLMTAMFPSTDFSQTVETAQVAPLPARGIGTGMDITSLGNIERQITNLGGRTLDLADEPPHTGYLDANDACWDWFVDPTPPSLLADLEY